MAIMDECKNCFEPVKCDEWIINTFECQREIRQPLDKDITDYEYPRDYPGKANKICNECKNFKKKNDR